MLRSRIIATTTHIPLSDYLETTYRPDREYVDGEIRERNVGKFEHARVQALLTIWLGNHESQWGIIGSTAQRVQVSPDRVRVPDVVVLKVGSPPDVLTEPPLLIIEILSPDDSYSDTQERARDYRNMGVETVWIIDPKTRTAVCVLDRNGPKPGGWRFRALPCMSVLMRFLARSIPHDDERADVSGSDLEALVLRAGF